MPKVGRPSLYTPELAAKICQEISYGYSIRTICKADEMPCPASIFLWLQQHKEFSEQYDKAKQEQAIAMAEEIIDIADDSSNDWMEANGREVQNTEAIQRSRLRVDTRKWLLSKMVPKKYGDKIQQEVTVNDLSSKDDDELQRQLAEKRQQHEQSKTH